MSHGDRVTQLPEGFVCKASTARCKIAAGVCEERKLYCVQFHPEVRHTDHGTDILRNFLYKLCGAKGDYNIDDYLEWAVENIREKVGDKKVLLALSGGVDSSVCAALIERAAPGSLTCVFVDHGLMSPSSTLFSRMATVEKRSCAPISAAVSTTPRRQPCAQT